MVLVVVGPPVRPLLAGIYIYISIHLLESTESCFKKPFYISIKKENESEHSLTVESHILAGSFDM